MKTKLLLVLFTSIFLVSLHSQESINIKPEETVLPETPTNAYSFGYLKTGVAWDFIWFSEQIGIGNRTRFEHIGFDSSVAIKGFLPFPLFGVNFSEVILFYPSSVKKSSNVYFGTGFDAEFYAFDPIIPLLLGKFVFGREFHRKSKRSPHFMQVEVALPIYTPSEISDLIRIQVTYGF